MSANRRHRSPFNKLPWTVLRALLVCLCCYPFIGDGSAQAPAPRSTGLLFVSDDAYRSIPLAAAPLMGGGVPENVDLASFFPPPGDQGQQSSCVGWAVAYALKGYQETRERHWTPTTAERQFSPAYIYNQIHGGSCDSGSTFVEALNLLRRDGVATLNIFPYDAGDCRKRPSEAARQAAKQFGIADWRRVNVQDEVEVKSHLASGFPVLIGMAVDRPFMRLTTGQVYDQFSGQSEGGHALVIVGYDNGRQAFKVINSWGGGWGDGGYGWIGYRAFRQAVREGYVAQDIVNMPPNPTPSPEPAPSPMPPAPKPPAPQVNPSANVGALQIRHDVPMGMAPNGLPTTGMAINVHGLLNNAAGRSIQLVVKFTFANGSPLFANVSERSYRDVAGLVATGTAVMPVTVPSFNLSVLTMSIPYYALNLQPTNFNTSYSLIATAFVYVDNFQTAQSAPMPLMIRW